MPFEVTDLATATDPYPLLHALRDGGPVVKGDAGFWYVAGYQSALDVLRHPAATSGPIALRYQQALPPGAARDEMVHRLNFLDPPDHPRVRGIVAKTFTPRRVNGLRPFVDATARRLLDELAGEGEFDVLTRFAHQVPSLVISELLGVPVADRETLTGWSDAVTPLLGVELDPDEKAGALAAAEEFSAYLSRLLDERRASPGEDLLSALLAAEEEGERLSRPELLSLAMTLYSAGHRTTRDLFTNGLSVLLAQPLDFRGFPIPTLVQEFLRYETPTLFVARVPSAPLVVASVELAPFEPAIIFLAAANRDPAVFDDPDTFDPARFRDETQLGPLSFAFGPHFCLGASLARMEAEVMLAAFLERLPGARLAGDALHWRQRGPFRGLTELRVVS